MTTLVEQLPALLGVLVGTGGAILATGIADRNRWQRQQTARWDERRLQAYVEFANAVKEVSTYGLRIAELENPNFPRPRVPREEALARMEDADVRRTKAWESVLLLGDEGTITAGRDWREAVTEIMYLGLGVTTAGFDLADSVRRADIGRDRYYVAARASLGIRGGAPPQSDWLAKRFGDQWRQQG
jgi:hypothetical protein